MPVNKIGKLNVCDAVFEQFKKLVMCGEWPPNSKIPSENELAQMAGCSRISVRAALQRLSSIGLIESRQGEGTFVTPLDGSHFMNVLVPLTVMKGESIFYIMEFRYLIECEQVALAAERATPEDIRRLRENYEEMRELEASSAEYNKTDLEFHQLVAQATKNPMFIKVSSILMDSMLESITNSGRNKRKHDALKAHERILQAVKDHDPEKARAEMKKHLAHTVGQMP